MQRRAEFDLARYYNTKLAESSRIATAWQMSHGIPLGNLWLPACKACPELAEGMLCGDWVPSPRRWTCRGCGELVRTEFIRSAQAQRNLILQLDENAGLRLVAHP